MKTLFAGIALLALLSPASCAWGHARHHRKHPSISAPVAPVVPIKQAPPAPPVDLTPITVLPYVVSGLEDPTRAAFQAKMHQEAGLDAPASRWITPDQVTSRSLFILQITQSLEGGFDSVNLHDRGILSWGIMQWASHCESLGQAMTYIKRRLLEQHQRAVWEKTFVANGLDADGQGLIVYGKPVRTAQDARLAFRGSLKPGGGDPKLMMHWAMMFGRAGRQPQIAALEVEYGGHIVDAILQKRLPGLPYHEPGRDGLTVDDLAASDPYAEALVFALWINNPRNAFAYVADAARATRAIATSDDPALWPPTAFGAALMRRCQGSVFGNWAQRAALIEAREETVHSAAPQTLTPFERDYQLVLTARKLDRAYEVASRHQQEVRSRAESQLKDTIALELASRRRHEQETPKPPLEQPEQASSEDAIKPASEKTDASPTAASGLTGAGESSAPFL